MSEAERLDPGGQSIFGRIYQRTYGGESLLGQAPWGESFGLGDLIPGTYKLSFLLNGYQQRLVEIQLGKLTLLTTIPVRIHKKNAPRWFLDWLRGAYSRHSYLLDRQIS